MRAHKDGVLTSASLMIHGEAAAEAIELARAMPTLAVGLHLVIAETAPTRAGLACLLPWRLRALKENLRKQFEAFAATGLPLDHVDGHMHLHVHPFVFPWIVKLALEFGAAGVRIPREPPARSSGFAGRARGFSLRAVSHFARRRSVESHLSTTDAVFGIARSGQMDVEYVIGVLKSLGGGSAEVIFHPTQGQRLDALGPNPGDLEALLHPRLPETIHELGIDLANYRLLNSQQRA